MHDEIRSELEEYLSEGTVSRSFTQHLENCPPCAREVEEMAQVSEVLQVFRESTEPVAPPLGFYSKVASRIESEEKLPLWGLFVPDLQFFRKIAFASLMLLAVLGSYLVSREADLGASASAEQATLTEHNGTVPHDSPADRQHIMVTLANYEH